jgi:hypothetical protein
MRTDGLVTDHGRFALQQRGPQGLVLRKWDLGILDVCPKKAPTHLLSCFHAVFATTRTSMDGVLPRRLRDHEDLHGWCVVVATVVWSSINRPIVQDIAANVFYGSR